MKSALGNFSFQKDLEFGTLTTSLLLVSKQSKNCTNKITLRSRGSKPIVLQNCEGFTITAIAKFAIKTF